MVLDNCSAFRGNLCRIGNRHAFSDAKFLQEFKELRFFAFFYDGMFVCFGECHRVAFAFLQIVHHHGMHKIYPTFFVAPRRKLNARNFFACVKIEKIYLIGIGIMLLDNVGTALKHRRAFAFLKKG